MKTTDIEIDIVVNDKRNTIWADVTYFNNPNTPGDRDYCPRQKSPLIESVAYGNNDLGFLLSPEQYDTIRTTIG